MQYKRLKILNCLKDFCCKNTRCGHNCCIGWQIDIDKKSIKKYTAVSGVFSEKLKNGIDFSNLCFNKTERKRCAFLNENNLCDIYINLGKNYLCKTCRDHPRYRNYFSDRVELGYGISCEEALDKVFSFKGKMAFTDVKNTNLKLTRQTAFEVQKLTFRESVIKITQNRDKSINERLNELLNFISVDKESLKNYDFEKVYLNLEMLNTSWENLVKGVRLDFDIQGNQTVFEQLLCYFCFSHIARAVDFLDLKSRTLFSVISFLEIYSISKLQDKELKEVARQYSEEIEYSSDNINKILDVTDTFVLK